LTELMLNLILRSLIGWWICHNEWERKNRGDG
jgi:hypothetical protein